jgi:hypothetical protein
MDGSTRPLSRRAFVRGALVTTVAAAAAAARPISETIARGAEVADELPPLAVHDPVVGVAARDRGLLAVGGHTGAPRAWSLAPQASAWQAVAGDAAFPATTSLLDVASHTTGFVAAGWRETAAGPRPSLLTSPDGTAWTLASLPEVGHGVCLTVAAKDGAALAVGTTFREAGVREPQRPVAFVSDVGGSWSQVPLDGVTPPTHGAVTMLAAARGTFLLATVDVTGSRLFSATSPSGPWRSVAAPKADQVVSYVAAADTGAGVLLAGIDAVDRPRYWLEGARGWRETTAPSGIAALSHVVGFARTPAALVAAGSDATGSFVEEVTAA